MRGLWKKNTKINIDRLLELIQSAKDSGTEEFPLNLGYYYDGIAALESAIEFPEDFCGEDKQKIISTAIGSFQQVGPNTIEELKKILHRLINQANNKKEREFVYVCQILLPLGFRIRRRQIGDCALIFRKRKNKLFDRDSIDKKNFPVEFEDDPPHYSWVYISTKAKSEFKAAEKASDSLDYFRGIWNFAFHFGQRDISFVEYPRTPRNKLTLGPMHTLHYFNGSLASDLVWYEPDFVEQTAPLLDSNRLNRLPRFEKWIRQMTESSQLNGFLQKALIRYVRALDIIRPEHSFLYLWGVLEYLTSKENEITNLQDVVRRAIFMSKDRELDRSILEHLRFSRNNLVHLTGDSGSYSNSLEQLHFYVKRLFDFILLNSKQFPSHDFMVDVLSQPIDIHELRNQEKIKQRARKLLGY